MLVKEYSHRIYSYSLNFSGSRQFAEEATQEAFFRIFKSIDRIEANPKIFELYLYKTAKNICIDNYRKHKGEHIVEEQDFMIPKWDPDYATKELVGYNPDGDLIVEIGYKVRVPEPIELRLNHRHGTALLSDLKGVEIDDRYSRIELSQIDSLKGTLNYGSATIDGVGGDVSLDASSGELTLENVKGTVKLTSRHSTGTELSNIDGDLIFEGKDSPLRITRVKGTTKITDSQKSVDIEDCGTVEFTGDHGKIGVIRSPRFLLKGGYNALSSEEVKEIRVEGKYNRVSGDADFLTLSGRADNVVATLKGADITEEGGKLSLEFPDLTLSSRFDLIDTTSALEFGPSQKIRFQLESYMNRLRSNFLTITSQGDTHTGTAGDANSPVSFILKIKYSDISLDRED